MIDFRTSTHSLTGRRMVEVWRDGVFIASIYGGLNSITVVSKYLVEVDEPDIMPATAILHFSK